jgi:ubiquinone biosynthesis protein COQ9
MSQLNPLQDINALEARLLTQAKPMLPEYGFTLRLMQALMKSLRMTTAELELVCPNGARDIAALMWRDHDKATEGFDVDGLKIRDKIGGLLKARLAAFDDHEDAAKRLIGYLSLPAQVLLLQSLVGRSADQIWRLAGDQALDENYYSKRLILSAILPSAILTRLMQGKDQAYEQIERNIDAVMQFERFKANISFKPEDAILSGVKRLGIWRYGASQPTKSL